jgi:transaldolase
MIDYDTRDAVRDGSRRCVVTTVAPGALIDCPMLQTVSGRPTDYWNDSCAIDELRYAVDRGATGATSNPSIVLEVLGKERANWQPRVVELAAANPSWTEFDLTWATVEEMAVRGAAILEPVYIREGGRKGRLSIQTNPTNYPNTANMLEQGRRFATLAPNMQVKFPATRAGIAALEAATAEGISVNATVCFTVPQAVAVAEAIERGLDAFEAAGGNPSGVTPVCTLMIGRLDDWMKVLAERDGIAVNPNALDWAGIATFKRAYGIFGKRGFRARLLAAAYRHRLHWTELVGGDIVMTLTHAWQVRFNESGIVPRPRIDEPVEPAIVDELLERIPDFRRAYDADGMTIDEFDGYGATVRTLRQFIRSYHDLVGAVRDIVLPDPDVKPA